MADCVLIVEDDDDVRAMLRLLLEDDGYSVLEAADGQRATTRALQDHPDLVILDLRLPKRHGLEVCRLVRRQSDVPILVVSAEADSVEIVAALEAGADDYVTKPFVPRELSARIRAHLRRAAEPRREHEVMQLGDLEIRIAAAQVTRCGRPIELTKTEFLLLRELADHRGAVLSREQLLQRVWGYDRVTDSRTVDAHVRRLRMKIEDDPSSPRYLQTVRGLGYRLVDDV